MTSPKKRRKRAARRHRVESAAPRTGPVTQAELRALGLRQHLRAIAEHAERGAKGEILWGRTVRKLGASAYGYQTRREEASRFRSTFRVPDLSDVTDAMPEIHDGFARNDGAARYVAERFGVTYDGPAPDPDADDGEVDYNVRW